MGLPNQDTAERMAEDSREEMNSEKKKKGTNEDIALEAAKEYDDYHAHPEDLELEDEPPQANQ
jgi:hypothetical protein